MGSYVSLPIPNVVYSSATPPICAKAAATIGDGVSTVISFNHGLGTTDVAVLLYRLSDGSVVLTQINIIDNNHVQFTFGVAPALNSLRAIVAG